MTDDTIPRQRFYTGQYKGEPFDEFKILASIAEAKSWAATQLARVKSDRSPGMRGVRGIYE